MNKIQLVFDKHSTADEVLDQIVRGRLKQIQEGLVNWNTDFDVQAACKTLLDYMEEPHAQD